MNTEDKPTNEIQSTPQSLDKSDQTNNPLHGVKLADMIEELVAAYGWEKMGSKINIRCFTHDPSIPSSLKFLRKTPWAREKVEVMYTWLVSKKSYKKSIPK